MVGVIGAEPTRVARVVLRDPPGQVVRLGARVDEENRVEAGGAGRDQPFPQLHGGVVEVPHVGVEHAPLPRDG